MSLKLHTPIFFYGQCLCVFCVIYVCRVCTPVSYKFHNKYYVINVIGARVRDVIMHFHKYLDSEIVDSVGAGVVNPHNGST